MDGWMDYHVRNDSDNRAVWITDWLPELIKVIFKPRHAPDASWIHIFFFHVVRFTKTKLKRTTDCKQKSNLCQKSAKRQIPWNPYCHNHSGALSCYSQPAFDLVVNISKLSMNSTCERVVRHHALNNTIKHASHERQTAVRKMYNRRWLALTRSNHNLYENSQ